MDILQTDIHQRIAYVEAMIAGMETFLQTTKSPP
jgi:hypothetical protein